MVASREGRAGGNGSREGERGGGGELPTEIFRRRSPGRVTTMSTTISPRGGGTNHRWASLSLRR